MTDAVLSPFVPGRRGEILDAALEVFSRTGYENGSMREIAAAVGVSEPALYRHFASKEEMFLALIEASATRLGAANFALIDPLEPGELHAQLVAAFVDRREAIRSYGHILSTVLSAAAHNPQFFDAYRDSIAVPMQARLHAKVLELDAAYGLEFTQEQTSSRVRAVLSMLVGYLVSSAVLADESDAAIADAVLRVLGYPES